MKFPRMIRVLFDYADIFTNDLINKYWWCYYSKTFNRINRWFDRHSETTLLCHDCCVFKMDVPDYEKWRPLFDRVCFHLGFNKKSADILWESIGIGNNWHHLHPTEAESKYSSARCQREFLCDVHYCSDRWSLDRLLRVQWMYRHWIYTIELEENCGGKTD